MAVISLKADQEFLIEKVLKNYSGIYEKTVQEQLTAIRRDKISVPVVYVGMGSCGITAGAGETAQAVRQYFESHHTDALLVEVGCLGLCSAEPVLDVQLPGKARVAFHHATAEKVDDLLNSVFLHQIDPEQTLGQYKHHEQEVWPNIPFIDQIPYFIHQQRIILRNAGVISPLMITDYIAHGGYKSLFKTVLNYTADKVCEIVENSELRGRGGGGFLTGRKWRIAQSIGSDNKYLICNADESDPGAFMNRAIMEGDPHRVIEGIAIAAYAIGAQHAFIYLRSDYRRSVDILENALAEAKACGFLGENIFGSGFSLSVNLRKGAGAYVCGEETALIASLEGRRGIPQTKPPYPAEKGLAGFPTVVNNIETLANLPAILENGPGWFRSIGTKESKGTKLFSITGKAKNTGFIEVPMGIPINRIVADIGGGVKNGKHFKALQVGGPGGVCIPEKDMSTAIGFESMAEIGASLGLGGLVVLDEDTCMVNLAKYFIGFLEKESCGKCIPCREGTKRMLQILENVTRRPREESAHETLERFKGIMELESLAEVIRDTSLCGLGQNAPNPVLSSLKWFREEFEEHIFDRKCRAGRCHDLRTFIIDTDICNGCNVCQRKCPETAIIGTIKQPHFIIEAKCTGCGICFESCKFNAIFYK